MWKQRIRRDLSSTQIWPRYLVVAVVCWGIGGEALAHRRAVSPRRTVGLSSAPSVLTARDQLAWVVRFRSTLLRAQGRIEFAHRWSWNTGDLVKHDCVDDGLVGWKKVVARAERHEQLLRGAMAKNDAKARRRLGSAIAKDQLRAIMLDGQLQKCGLRALFLK